jgi:hypothetical protein
VPTTTFTNQYGNTTTTTDNDAGAISPYPATSGPASIALLGPPVANLPNIETSTNVAATALAVYESGGRPTNVSAQQPVQWQGAALVGVDVGSVPQSPLGVPGYPYTVSNFNETNGITSTEQFLQNVIEVERTQQGTNVISNVLSITASFGGVPAAQIAVFRFQ